MPKMKYTKYINCIKAKITQNNTLCYLLFFRAFLIIHYDLNIMYNEMWALLSMKQQENIYRTDKFLIQDCSSLKTLWGLPLCLCQNNNIRVLEEFVPLHFLCNIWQASKFLCIPFVSHGITLEQNTW